MNGKAICYHLTDVNVYRAYKCQTNINENRRAVVSLILTLQPILIFKFLFNFDIMLY